MSYYKPIRRKFGVATLLMACAFASGWIRSVSTYDAFAMPFNFGIASWDRGHLIGRIQPMPIRPLIYGQQDPPETGWPLILTAATTFEFVPPVMTIRYQWIVLPLTLLSAWLLLSKPRQMPAKAAE